MSLEQALTDLTKEVVELRRILAALQMPAKAAKEELKKAPKKSAEKKPKPAEPVETKEEITADMLRAKAQEIVSRYEDTKSARDSIKAVLAEQEVKKISELDVKDYAKVLDALNKL